MGQFRLFLAQVVLDQFSHLTNEEFKAAYTGGQGGSTIGSDDAHLGELEIGEIAAALDWSTNAAVVNPVKDQGQCGSCWAFSAVGTVESAYAISSGKLGSYAEQQVVDCSSNGGSQGCNGGFNQYGIEYIGQTGIAAESSYPYKATDGTCRESSVSKELPAGTVAGYNTVGTTNEAFMSALNTQPLSITVNLTALGNRTVQASSPRSVVSLAASTMLSLLLATTVQQTRSRFVILGDPAGVRMAMSASTTL